MKRKIICISALSLMLFAFLLVSCNGEKEMKEQTDTQLAKVFISEETNDTVHYWFYLPEDYYENEATPLIIFLHGAGERGDNLSLVKKHGPAKILENESMTFIVISPQCPEEQWWDIELLNALVEKIIDGYNVDRQRVYLTGLSMGGYGTWALSIAYPEKFAAIAPVCGGGDTTKVHKIKDIPAWVFHGAKDNAVPHERSVEMVEALKKAGGEVKFTLYPDANHDSWTETYDNPELYEWFLDNINECIDREK
ncbi:MAG: prolyl oligopeptidase family serine peptidase [Bacteroidales bacterium]|nr:prolyl oligopeptidase family serine peptidase [Bacteroidales bacterium]